MKRFTKYPSNYISASKGVTDKLNDLRKLLQEYKQTHESIKLGSWKLDHCNFEWSEGDTWDLYYKNKMILSRINNRLNFAYIGKPPIDLDDYSAIQDVILEVFPDTTPITFDKLPDKYSALLGFNTKQLWVYDEENDVYIDPPAEVLDALPEDQEEAEKELARIANEENPDWLLDEDYWYGGETDI